jgi:hypothetical protein
LNGWIWLIICLALLAALLAVRIRISAGFDASGLQVRARLGRLTVFRIPGRGGPKGKPGKEKKRKPKKQEEKPEEKGGSVPDFRELVSIITDSLGKLRRKLRIDELTLWYCSAGPDPMSAAMAFGGASAAAGLLIAPLERVFRVKKRDVRTAVSFTDEKPTVIARLSLSLSIFAIFAIALPAGVRFLRATKDTTREAADTSDSGTNL